MLHPCGLEREVLAAVDQHSVGNLIGAMGAAPVWMILLGASSLAFHLHPSMQSEMHTADILFGLLLVLHVAHFTSATYLTLRSPKTYHAAVRVACSAILALSLTLVVIFYSEIYLHQPLFYGMCALVATIFGALCRLRLAGTEGGWVAYALAASEVVVVVACTVAALYGQGSVLGHKDYLNAADVDVDDADADTDKLAYDVFHGNWHFLFATVVGLLHSRCADVAANDAYSLCVVSCGFPKIEAATQALLVVYSVTVIVLKETKLHWFSSTCVLASLLFLTVIAALRSTWLNWRRTPTVKSIGLRGNPIGTSVSFARLAT